MISRESIGYLGPPIAIIAVIVMFACYFISVQTKVAAADRAQVERVCLESGGTEVILIEHRYRCLKGGAFIELKQPAHIRK